MFNNFRIAIILSGIFLITCNLSYSQSSKNIYKYNPPMFIFELAGTFNDPTGDSHGNIGDFFSFKNFGLVHGIGFEMNIKYAANKKGTIYPFFNLGFSHLQNSDEETAYIDSNIIANGYPLQGNLLYNSTPGSSILTVRSFHAGIGVDYQFFPRKSVMPFTGIQLDYNYIWGYYTQRPSVVAGNASTSETTFKINGTSRFGIGINAGTHLRISENLGFVLGVNYRIANLIGKNSERTYEINSLNLLDKSATELNTNLSSNRSFSYFQFILGFTVYIGKKM